MSPQVVRASRSARMPLWLLALTVAGCQATQRQARQSATGRWNAVRAAVKARLAADQLAAGNVADAAGELADAVRLDPGVAQVVPLQARVHLARGQTRQAQRFLERAAAEGRGGAEVEYLLGVVWQQRQQWETAREHFERASRQDPEQVAYFVAVVEALLQLGQAPQALAWLESGQERFGWTAAYQAARAECCEQLGDWATAATAWCRVLGAGPEDVGLRERAGLALYRAGRFDEAVPILSGLVSAPPPEDGQAAAGGRADVLRLALADCLLETGRDEAARGVVSELLRKDEHNALAWRLLARILAAQGQYQRAHGAAEKALALDRDDRRALELAAALAYRSGNRDRAAALAARLRARASQGDDPVAELILSRGP